MKRRWKGEGGTSSHPILLPHDEADRIAAGRKTQMRRIARNLVITDPDTGARRVEGLRPSALKPGLTYEIQTATDQPVVARITITKVTEQALVDITADQARAEGFHDKFDRGKESDGVRARSLFADDWMRRHDRTWPLWEEQLCPKCEGHAYVDGERCDGGCDDVGTMMVEARMSPEQILKVFEARHAKKWVWVIEFEPAQHLYLHRKTDGGYTADVREALLDAGEVLDPPSPDWATKAVAHRREALRADGRLAGLSTPEERLNELRRMHAARGLDDSEDMRAIGDRLDRIEDAVRKAEKRAA